MEPSKQKNSRRKSSTIRLKPTTSDKPIYVYRWDRMGRKGQPCRVLVRGKRNSCLVQFAADQHRAVTSRNALRKATDQEMKWYRLLMWEDRKLSPRATPKKPPKDPRPWLSPKKRPALAPPSGTVIKSRNRKTPSPP